MRSFKGKKALVTGAASGIGRAIALALAAEGAVLRLLDIDASGLGRTAEEVRAAGAEAATMVCDLASAEQVSGCVSRILTDDADLSILINAAGIAHYGPLHLAADGWDRVIAVNLTAPIQLVRALLPTLCRQPAAHVLNVSSIAGLVPMTRVCAYQTSKFGLVGFTLALRAEYQRPGFGITCLCPGFVRTPLLDGLVVGHGGRSVRLPRWASTTAEHVASRALRAMRASQGLVVMTPLAAAAWLGWRLAPGLYGWSAREGWRTRGPIPQPELIAAAEDRPRA